MPAQVWSISGLGGTLGTPMLSERIRFSAYGRMRFAQFVNIEAKFGPNRTDRLDYKKAGKVSVAGRVHAEGEPIQEATITFFSDSVFIAEISNSVSFTDRVEELAKLSIRSAIIQRLKDDAAATLDTIYAGQFQGCDIVYVPTGSVPAPTYTVTTNAAAGASATRNFQADDVKNLIDLMKSTYKAPAYDNDGRFVFVGGTQAMRGLKDSRDIIDAQLRGAPERLFYGEVGEFYSCRFCEENNVLGSNLGTNANLGEGIMFGEDPVIEIVAKPLQLQAKVGIWERERGIRYVVWM
jgi:N4-gp56 family major capsid protein